MGVCLLYDKESIRESISILYPPTILWAAEPLNDVDFLVYTLLTGLTI